MNRPTYGYNAASNPDPQAQPVCPRHPDRVSYVSCKRCERPACPDCQRPTPVGALCVDCERDLMRQQASTRPRNAMGATISRRRPVVTYTVMALCIVLFIAQELGGNLVESYLLFGPYWSLAMPWTFITAGFLHGGVLHLLLNMYALWMCGQYLEQTLGHARFAAIYFVSILGGHTAVYVLSDPLSQSWFTGTLGASGGVFGLFAALFIVNRRMGAQTAQIALLIGVNLLLTFTIPGISWQGHLGGLVLGALLTAGMFWLRPKAVPGADRQALARRSALIHAGVVAAGVTLCVALLLVKILSISAL